ncbi:DUF4238 domain-containing protein [Mesorhizobium sp. AR10]|uniref:DUF4238 domain-containing protein n=1 Tax=Mesorhizobium sp. AR10 TaxID=2865839 RepID=UPI00215E2D07|nr:DUF4238 domain-containing protein [Mesorhizobium sp. AR10]UVK36723.1 DUF4238 domain-containing protein [Mesorhizobium sp. AR10]
MQKQKENNHFISEFQLKYFSCPPPAKKPGKHYIWVYTNGKDAECKNTKWVGSSSNFYGKDDDRLEDLLAITEGKNGQIFKEITSKGEILDRHESQLGDLFWILAFRTRALRERLRGGFTAAIDLMAERSTSDKAQAFYKQMADKELEKKIAEMTAGLNVFQRLQLKNDPEFLKRVRLAREVIASGALTGIMQDGFRNFSEVFKASTAIDEGHNKGLEQFLTSGGKCPDSVRPLKWCVVTDAANRFVLGDSGVFSRTENGAICSLIGISSDWFEVYLPISPSTAVVGMRHNNPPSLSVEGIMAGAISTSYEQFYSNAYSSSLESRARIEIDTNNEFFDQSSLEGIVTGVWDRKVDHT